MIGFVNGEKLLTESDLPPRWNLLIGTQDFSGPFVGVVKSTDKFSDFAVSNYFNSIWMGETQYYNASIGTYTFSVFARDLNGNSDAFLMTSFNNNSEKTPNGETLSKAQVSVESVSIKLTNNWQKFVVTFNVSSNGGIKPRIETDESNRKIQLAGFKLEHGSKATDWMPAVSDLMLKNQNGGVRAANPLVSMLYVPSEMEVA